MSDFKPCDWRIGDTRCSEYRNRIAELELRYKAATGLLLSWSNYPNREWMEDEIDKVLGDEDG